MTDRCTDKRLGDMLYAFEAGMLNDSDRETFEIHLLECRYCSNRATRFADAARLIRHDSSIREEVARLDTGTTATRKKWTRSIAVLAAAAVVILLISTPWHIDFHTGDEAIARENSLVVMYFDNLVDSEDSLRLGEIAANLLITDLSESRYIQVVAVQRLYDVLKLLDRHGPGFSSRDVASEVARETKSAWLLTGSILQIDPSIVVTAELTETSTGASLAAFRIDGQPEDNLFALVDDLTVQIKNSLSLPVAANEERDPLVADMTSHSPEAYRHYFEGLDHRREFRFASAITSFERAVELDSSFAMAYYHLSGLKDRRLISRAVQFLDRATHKEQLYIRSREAVILGNRQLAIDILQEILEKHPEDKTALHRLAGQMSLLNQHARAIELWNKVVSVDPLDRNAHNYLAYAYDVIGDTERALAAADRYVELAPSTPNPHDTRGEILARNGRLKDAIEAYERVYELEPDFLNYESLFKLGRLLVYQGDYARAEECFEEIAAGQRILASSVARTFLALIPMYQGKFEDALGVLNEGISLDSLEQQKTGQIHDKSTKHFLKARIFVERSNHAMAQQELAKAVEIQASIGLPAYRNMYAQVLAEGGETNGAEEIAEVLGEESRQGVASSQPAYWYAMGCINMAKGETEQAVTSFERAVAASAGYEYNIMLAQAYVMAERYADVIALLKDLQTNYAQDSRLGLCIWTVKSYYYLGFAYEHIGQVDDAIRSYEEFLRIWANADPCLSEVDDARERLARLKSQS